jgi:uncharacterized phage protein (TIGR01671 family)
MKFSPKKFRIWDKIAHRMIYPGEILENEKGEEFIIFIYQDGSLYECFPCEFCKSIEEWYKNTQRYELMQFTGLYDVNGKEIYEGDIVKVKEFNDEIMLVYFEDGYFGFGNYEVRYGRYSFDPINNLIEVVGNIFENPELLKIINKK